MTRSLLIGCFSLALTALALPALAQNSNPAPPNPPNAVSPTPPNQKPPTVNQRRENQQDRIAQGVKSGQLTAGETSRIENRETAINHEVRADRRADDGHLTQGERRQVNRQVNSTSRQIYRDKHNAAKQ